MHCNYTKLITGTVSLTRAVMRFQLSTLYSTVTWVLQVTLYCLQCTMICRYWAVYKVLCTVYNVLCTAYNVFYSYLVLYLQCKMYWVQLTVYNVQCTMCSLDCTVFCLYCTWPRAKGYSLSPPANIVTQIIHSNEHPPVRLYCILQLTVCYRTEVYCDLGYCTK